MRILLAIVFPFLAFFSIGKPMQGILCLILQITLFGWLPAAIWAVIAVNSYYADRRQKGLIDALKNRG